MRGALKQKLSHCGGRLSHFSRSAPIEVLNIFLRIVLAPAIDEPLIGRAWFIDELDPVMLINFCNLFADCRLTFNDQFVRW